MQLRKYDEITAHMMEYLDKHIKLTPEELEAQKNTNQKKQGSKGDPTKKQKLEVSEAKPDIMFGIMVNVAPTSLAFTPIDFGFKRVISTILPTKQSS